MVEAVEGVGDFVDVSADFVWCFFFEGVFDGASEFGQFQHEVFLAGVYCREEFSGFEVSAFFFVTVQDGFDSYNCVEDVRTCVSFEGGEAVDVEDVVFGCLVGEVTVFDCGEAYYFGCFLRILVFDASVFDNLVEHFFVDVCDQVFKTHNAAVSCLEWFAVFSVHGTEAKEGKFCLWFYETGLSCAAEYLDEVEFLAFVYDVEDLIRIEEFYSFYDRCKVCCCIKGCSVGFEKHAWRDFFGICVFFDIYNECSLIFVCEALVFHHLDHIRDVWLCVGFLFPEVEGYI